jgi:poly-gamma-glutamate capsule biosynthesis protein CapA/YwtB (metallophosphatase superfamily)
MRSGVTVLTVAALGAACGGTTDRIHFSVTIEVVDETGAAVAANLEIEGTVVATGADGRARLDDLTGPVLVVVSGDDLLDEPVAIGRDDAGGVVRVRAWRSLGGRRWSMHAAGDVMFGRRYNAPTEGDPLIPAGDVATGAAAVVEDVRRAYTAADLRMLNLETVVSNLPPETAYPGKRFILNSWPETLAGVEALAPHAVIVANNHARDHLDVGIAETHAAMHEYGLAHSGSSPDAVGDDAPLVLDVAGLRVGVLAWTTVEGSFVNDNYPLDGDPVPGDLDPSEAWQYDARTWGFTGASWSAPTADRRIGSAWALFDAAQADLPADETAAAWASLVAVYPELQDWVKRRGHGGAEYWSSAASTARIAELAAEVDVVVVQLHAGFQFMSAPSDFVRDIARDAIDAGADIVIGHHPHVLQGAEWYRGKLVVYSLGNFVFDQDFLSTFASGFLRTIWDGDELVEARLIPVEIVGYRPTPAADVAARRTLLRVWEMSVARTTAGRDDQGDLRVFPADLDAETAPAQVRIEHHSAVLLATAPAGETRRVRVEAGATTALGLDGLVDPRLGLAPGDADLWVGRDLFGWGGFEDQLAESADDAGAHWVLEAPRKHVVIGNDAAAGVGYLRLERTAENVDPVSVRPVARVPLPAHRLHDGADGQPATPLDPPATYSIRGRARLTGDGAASLRLDLYTFDDTDPTEDPTSLPIGELELTLPVASDGRWHDLEVDIPAEALVDGGERANMVMINLRLGVPATAELSNLDIDQLALVEWRLASDMPDRPGVYEYVRNVGDSRRDLDVPMIPAGR